MQQYKGRGCPAIALLWTEFNRYAYIRERERNGEMKPQRNNAASNKNTVAAQLHQPQSYHRISLTWLWVLLGGMKSISLKRSGAENIWQAAEPLLRWHALFVNGANGTRRDITYKYACNIRYLDGNRVVCIQIAVFVVVFAIDCDS